jgi:hypothetical protein
MELVGMQVAVIVITISIVLSGILIGLGRALGYTKVERFGVDELFQSILNAAIVGALVVIIETVKAISTSLVTPVCSTAGDAIGELSCVLKTTTDGTFLLLQELLKASTMVGFYQTMILELGAITIQPFANLESVSSVLSNQAGMLGMILILINLNAQIVNFFAQNALMLFLPIGLILRSFFATRKVGGFLIGVAIGMYVLYPAFILSFSAPDLSLAGTQLQEFNSNPLYATMPIVDLNNNNAIAEKLDNMTTGNNVSFGNNVSYVADLPGSLTLLTQANANAISQLLMYGVFAPLFSLIITLVFIKEMSGALGSEYSFNIGVI